MTTPVVGASVDFLAGLLTLFDFLMGSSGEAGTVEFSRSKLLELSCLLRMCYSCSIAKIVISGGMHANLVSLGDCLVFSKEVVNDNFGESRVVHLILLFVTSVIDLTSVDDSSKSSPGLMHMINNDIGDCLDFPSMTKLFEERHNIFISWKCIKVLTMKYRTDLKDVFEDFQIEVEFLLLVHSEPVGIFLLLDRIPELVHVNFRNICSDEKCGIARSESKSIQDNLKCRFSLFLSRIESSVAFSNLKSFLLGNKF
ncbi:hypothetical protein Tco_0857839 [Tanacetum coccineum]|uniref:Uncharacterized protein n=1 Tax=Tanacetum coccineum TaxID=301880 RepID=A0ABQ5BAQ3_9ASTR